MIEFGKTYQDVITGFVGVATGRCSYITGCSQALLAPAVDSTGARREPQWFDEVRCKLLDSPIIALETGEGAGADIQAPVR